MTQLWQRMRGYVAVGVALLTCPCHIRLALPFLLALTSGTLLGTWLAANQMLLYLVSAVLFIGGLWFGKRWLNPTISFSACSAPVERNEEGDLNHIDRPNRIEFLGSRKEESHV